MYVQCKQGFVEIDRWDGATIPDSECAAAVAEALAHGARLPGALVGVAPTVLVARSRADSTLQDLAGYLRRNVRVIKSPIGWDYEWRMFVTTEEWAAILCGIAEEIDYRNFKTWNATEARAGTGDDELHARRLMAHDIWHACHRAYGQVRECAKAARLGPLAVTADRVAAWERGPARGSR